jgi:hypothetical protein
MTVPDFAKIVLDNKQFLKASKLAQLIDTDKEKAEKEFYDIISPHSVELDPKYDTCEGMRYRPFFYMLFFSYHHFEPELTRKFIVDCSEHVSLTAKYILSEKRGISNNAPFGPTIDKLEKEGLISSILKQKLSIFNLTIYRPAKHWYSYPAEYLRKFPEGKGHLFGVKDAIFALFIALELVQEMENESQLYKNPKKNYKVI